MAFYSKLALNRMTHKNNLEGHFLQPELIMSNSYRQCAFLLRVLIKDFKDTVTENVYITHLISHNLSVVA